MTIPKRLAPPLEAAIATFEAEEAIGFKKNTTPCAFILRCAHFSLMVFRHHVVWRINMSKTRATAAPAAGNHHGAIAVTLTLCSIGVATPSSAEEAVQWRAEDGGNGHWYRLVPWSETPCIPNTDCWHDFKSHAESVGGHLVTFTSADELNWVYTRLVDRPEAWQGTIGPTIGLHQPTSSPNYVEPAGGWRWVDGTPMVFTNWGPGEPNDQLTQCECENWAYFGGTGNRIPTWFDGGDGGSGTLLIEWDTDCNGDGIVDHGQILDGTFLDLDGNGMPDCCDEGRSCPGDCRTDLSGDGLTDSVDLGLILALWGTDGRDLPQVDIDGNGLVDSADLGLVLGHWGPCPE